MKNYILSREQEKIIKNLGFLRRYGFYLAGGTALALQLGHRTSQDLDFYTQKPFDSEKLRRDLSKIFGPPNEYSLAKNILRIKIGKTDLSFFRYQYPLIKRVTKTATIDLASIEDIAAMKMIAIYQRGKKRDFVDMYFLIKQYGLEKIFQWTKKKYPSFNEYSGLLGLSYFVDAEKKEQGRKRIYIYSNERWPDIKDFLIKEVKKYQLNMFKKKK